MTRNKPWQIAADIEKLAAAIEDAGLLFQAIDRSADAQLFAIAGIDLVDNADALAKALRGLSDRYQAVADAEEMA